MAETYGGIQRSPEGCPRSRPKGSETSQRRWWALGLGQAFLVLGYAGGVSAQVPDSLQIQPVIQAAEEVAPDSVRPGITPRGAFIRSSIIPGWGHTKVGAFVRGGFYFAAEAASAIMIYKTQTRIRSTEQRLAAREAVVRARLLSQGITDPVEVEAGLAEDPEYEDLTALRETRAEQREDWIALGIFLMLIGGVDAYVSAHLADFPTAVVVEPTPDQGLEVRLSVPVGF